MIFPGKKRAVKPLISSSKKELLDRLNIVAKEAAKQHDFEHLKKLGNNENFNYLYGVPTLVIVSGNKQVPVHLDTDYAVATRIC